MPPRWRRRASRKEPTEAEKPAEAEKPTRRRQAAKSKAEENPAAKKAGREEGGRRDCREACREEEHGQEGGRPKKAPARKKKPAGDTPAGYIRELVAGAGTEGIMLSTITDALRAKFKDFKVRDLGYSQMRQYMASVGDYELEKSGRNFRVRLSQ